MNEIREIHYKSIGDCENNYWWHQIRYGLVLKYLTEKLAKNSTIVDIGCGMGGFINFSSKYFYDVYGIDNHQHQLPINIKIKRNNINEIAELSEVQGITFLDVIEHIEDDKMFLNHIYKIAPVNSVVIATVPAMPGLFSDYDRKLGHYRRYTKNQLIKIFNDSGFKVKKCHYFFSFLIPIAFLRLFGFFTDDTFPKVPPFINFTLIQLSRIEVLISKMGLLPFGTSIILVAEK